MNAPDSSLVERVAALTGKRPVAWRHAEGGHTPAERWIVGFEDGTSCFAKAGEGTPHSPVAEWLRSEYHVYSHLEAPFMPRLLGWDDDGTIPLLLLEDLSAAHWPPPWRPGDVEAVFGALASLHGRKLDVPKVTEATPELTTHWLPVRDDPAPFLSLGLCSAAWLQHALPLLIDAARAADVSGSSLLHLDTRSDNICFDGDRVLLVDWNFAVRGNADLDIAGWLPSLHSEGGPLPEEVLPNAPHWASLLAGFFAARVGLPPIPGAPLVRQVQLRQLRSALPWAVRALNLPPLDGPNAPMSS